MGITTIVTFLLRTSVSSPMSFCSDSYQIRSAEVGDLSQLADVLTSSFYPPLGWQRWFYPVIRLGIYEDLKQRLQTPQRHYRCWAAIATHATQRDQVVGTVEMSCRRYALWMLHQPRQIYLSNLAVQVEYRRQGVARRLLEASERQALAWGFREVYLHVMADNAQARRLYQRMGYQVQQIENNLFAFLNPQPPRLLLKKVLVVRKPPTTPSPRSPQPLPQ